MLIARTGGSTAIGRMAIASLNAQEVSYARSVSRPAVGSIGVPLRTPDSGSKARPSGIELSNSSHAHGPKPGVHERVCAYGTLNVPFGSVVGVMRTGGIPGRSLMSPDSASAASSMTPATSGPAPGSSECSPQYVGAAHDA